MQRQKHQKLDCEKRGFTSDLAATVQ
uniref:Uncharacterized protein n=1 Tax=Arundo donax TaxID=35708 RepID=A0A0A9DY30_ARUDO